MSSKKDSLGKTKKAALMEYMLSVVLPDAAYQSTCNETEARLRQEVLATIPSPSIMAVLEEYDAVSRCAVLSFSNGNRFEYTKYGNALKGNSTWSTPFSTTMVLNFDPKIVVPKKFFDYCGNGPFSVVKGSLLEKACMDYTNALWSLWANLNEKRTKYYKVISAAETLTQLARVWPEVESLRSTLWPAPSAIVPLDPTLSEFIRKDARKA